MPVERPILTVIRKNPQKSGWASEYRRGKEGDEWQLSCRLARRGQPVSEGNYLETDGAGGICGNGEGVANDEQGAGILKDDDVACTAFQAKRSSAASAVQVMFAHFDLREDGEGQEGKAGWGRLPAEDGKPRRKNQTRKWGTRNCISQVGSPLSFQQ